MPDFPTLKTRREFLRSTLLGGSLAWTVPAFLGRTLSQMQVEAENATRQPVTGVDGNILVVVQLAGGNDGLNTVIPYTNDYYFRARPRLSADAKAIHKLSPSLGLHSGLEGLKAL